jgi:hypothetical protein
MVDVRRRYDQRLREIKKADYETLPGELVADLTALAGRLNDEAAEWLIELTDRLMKDLDEAAQLHSTIRELTTDQLANELAGTSLGEYGMTISDKMSVMTSFSSGRSLASLTSVVAGTAIMPPIGIALGLGMGALFAFQAFVTRDQHAFVAAFNSWMQAQISQAQLTINNSFQRRMMDIQDQIRTTITQALSEREREITASLQESQRLLQSETSKRQAAQQQLQQRLEAIRAARTDTEKLLVELRAPQ